MRLQPAAFVLPDARPARWSWPPVARGCAYIQRPDPFHPPAAFVTDEGTQLGLRTAIGGEMQHFARRIS